MAALQVLFILLIKRSLERGPVIRHFIKGEITGNIQIPGSYQISKPVIFIFRQLIRPRPELVIFATAPVDIRLLLFWDILQKAAVIVTATAAG